VTQQKDSEQKARAPKPLTAPREQDSSPVKLWPVRTPPKPFTAADNEEHLKAVVENIRRNAGKPMS
jgi:hypothetical protein